MSKHGLKYLLATCVALLFFSRMMPAQSLPPLPTDSCIQKGTLGCGVAYYMVTRPSEKGYAHIAVVQRDEPLSDNKREALDTAFLARMGVASGPEGFVSDIDGSTVYHFTQIPFYRPEALDSTLLYSFSLVAASKAQQAVIVSGDIDAVELKKKMDIFSMLVPRMLVKEAHQPDYVWEPSPAPLVKLHPGAPAEISVTYAGARIPFPYMNTAQAIVTDLFGMEFQALLRHRLSRNLRDAGIPYGDIRFRSLRSADYGGDERYTVQVQVAREHLDPAMRVLSSTLAEIDAFGIPVTEFMESKQVILPQLRKKADVPASAAVYVSRCVANFLYGASLASRSEWMRLFSRKNVADTTEARLFNQFAGALLEQLSNLTLEYRDAPDSLDKDDALFYYNLAYLYGSVIPSRKDYAWHQADTLGLPGAGPKIRVKSEKAEPLSGGVLWTFTNGMRVIYKHIPGSVSLQYALQLNGGLGTLDGLQSGEGGYIGEMLPLYDVGGLPAARFRDLLEVQGIRMETEVGLNGMAIRGEAPPERLSLLLKALLGLANNRNLNRSEFEAYSACQALRQAGPEEWLESSMYPGYAYTEGKNPASLRPETQDMAEAFFAERFAHMNDGILILSGNLGEELVKRQLLKYLGGFHTQRGVTARKAVVLSPRSGVNTLTQEGPARGLYLMLDCEWPLTSEHYYTAQVAVEALRKSLVAHLTPYGYSCQLRLSCMAQPQERFRLFITCRPLPAESLPAGMEERSPEQALTAVRAALREASRHKVEAADLKAWKARLDADTRSRRADASGTVGLLLMRYAHNKDFASRAAEQIAAIRAEAVQELLEAWAAGGRIEWRVP